jgi:pimeloyl-ACP methyl ester carboxylesterase
MSQGGWIVPLAATRSQNVAFVVNLSGPVVTVREQTHHEMRNNLRRAGVSDASMKDAFDLMALLERHIRGEVPWQEYEAALRARRVGLSGLIYKDFPSKPDDWDLGFYSRVGAFDPLPYWRRVKVPFLILYGELDDQDKAPVKPSVARLREALADKDPGRWTVKVFPDTGHGFGDRAKGGIRKDFLEYLTNWVRDNAR